jgi:hypothetical protein
VRQGRRIEISRRFSAAKRHKNTQKRNVWGQGCGKIKPAKAFPPLNQVFEEDFCARFAPFCG